MVPRVRALLNNIGVYADFTAPNTSFQLSEKKSFQLSSKKPFQLGSKKVRPRSMRLSAATLASSDCSETAIAATRRRKLLGTTDDTVAARTVTAQPAPRVQHGRQLLISPAKRRPAACCLLCSLLLALCRDKARQQRRHAAAGRETGGRSNATTKASRSHRAANDPLAHTTRAAALLPQMWYAGCGRAASTPGPPPTKRDQRFTPGRGLRKDSQSPRVQPEYAPSMLRVHRTLRVWSPSKLRVHPEYALSMHTPSMLRKKET